MSPCVSTSSWRCRTDVLKACREGMVLSLLLVLRLLLPFGSFAVSSWAPWPTGVASASCLGVSVCCCCWDADANAGADAAHIALAVASSILTGRERISRIEGPHRLRRPRQNSPVPVRQDADPKAKGESPQKQKARPTPAQETSTKFTGPCSPGCRPGSSFAKRMLDRKIF